jgi:uncharacterized OB-fold protein
VTSTAEVTDEQLLERWKGVHLDHVNKGFWRGLLSQELRLNRCSDCGHWHHRPKPVCPQCWSKNVVATPVSGAGTIHLLILLYQGPPVEGVDYSTRHPVVVVELDEQEGLRFTSTVVDSDVDELAIGQRVELTWIERSSRPHPVFRRVAGEGPAR